MTLRPQFPAIIVMILMAAACGSNPGASVSFVAPEDDATVSGGARLRMAAEGIEIEEAGAARDGAGHFHVIADDGCTAKDAPIMKDADHVHFGQGQTEGVVYLEPGDHDMCLEVGDGVHRALGISATTTITVAITDQDQWCAVIAEVDGLFSDVDQLPEDLALQQLAFENIRRLTVQLADAMDVIDADVTDEVDEAIAFAMGYADAYVKADDVESVEASIEQVFAGIADGTVPGSEWIQTECGVDIGG